LTDALTGNTASPGQTAGGDARPDLAGNTVRQWRDQARNLANDAQDLRRQLQSSGVKDLAPVDDVIKALRAMDSDKFASDPRNAQQLSTAALDKMKKLEFDLRKRTDTSNDSLYLSGSEDAPAAFRPMVDEYYRALSKKSGAPAPAQAPTAKPKGGGK